MNRFIVISAMLLLTSSYIGVSAQKTSACKLIDGPVYKSIYYEYSKDDSSIYVETAYTHEHDERGRVIRVKRTDSNGQVQTYIHTYIGCKETIHNYVNDTLFYTHEILYSDSSYKYDPTVSFPTYKKPLSYSTVYENSLERYVYEFKYDSLGRETDFISKTYYHDSLQRTVHYITTYTPYKSTHRTITIDADGESTEEQNSWLYIYEDAECLRLSMTIYLPEMKITEYCTYVESGDCIEQRHVRRGRLDYTLSYKYYDDRNEIYRDGILQTVSYYK